MKGRIVVRETSLYVVMDKLAEDCGPVFEANNDEVARRKVWQLLRKVPVFDRDCFVLVRLGDFYYDVKLKTPVVQLENAHEVDINLPRFEELNQKEMLKFEEEKNA